MFMALFWLARFFSLRFIGAFVILGPVLFYIAGVWLPVRLSLSSGLSRRRPLGRRRRGHSCGVQPQVLNSSLLDVTVLTDTCEGVCLVF